MCFRLWLAALMVAVSILIPAIARAGSVEVRPTMLMITPSQRIAILTLNNPEASAEIYQARIYRWQQSGDMQSLQPTDDVIVSPPIATISSHGTQTIRIGLRKKDLPVEEETYRLILEEVPNPQAPETHGLNIALKISLPLFVRPQIVPSPAQLAADVSVKGKEASVTVHNTGRFAARVVHIEMKDPSGGATLEQKCLTYILPGGWNTYTFNLPATPAAFREATLTLQSDEGDIELKAPVEYVAMTDAPAPALH